MGLAISPSASRAKSKARQDLRLSLRAQRSWASNASMKKNPLSTSLRVDTQATDSTCSGCRAKTPAANALGQGSLERRSSARKSSNAPATWRARLVAWKAPGSSPKSSASSIQERRVSGNQLAPWKLVKAQTKLSRRRPARTSGRSLT